MKDFFKFYSVCKNEDATPYNDNNILVVADGLGGSGSAEHDIDRSVHGNLHEEIIQSAYGDFYDAHIISPSLVQYIEELIAPMTDGKNDTSALWASRIVIARCVYALTEGEFKDCDLSNEAVREQLAKFISKGLGSVAAHFNFQKGKYDGQLLLPTTLAFIRYKETKNSVVAETVWAGDSRCYALTTEGLRLLSVDDEDKSGSITNLFFLGGKKVVLNYLRHQIKTPCILLAISDGIFDPFSPNDHLGVENTLLSSIVECNSYDELSDKLKTFYDKVRQDDSTVAFASFGFDNYADMKKRFEKRAEKSTVICQKQKEMQIALEVMTQSEEDVSRYVISRTRDKYEKIVNLIASAAEGGVDDIAIGPKIKEVIEESKREQPKTPKTPEPYEAPEPPKAPERVRLGNREEALDKLYDYVLEHPEHVYRIFVRNSLNPTEDTSLFQNYASFLNTSSSLKRHLERLDGLKRCRRELDEKREHLHFLMSEKIAEYRSRFDVLWGKEDREACKRVYNCLRTWHLAYYLLVTRTHFYPGENLQISLLPDSEKELAYEVTELLVQYRNWNSDYPSVQNTIKSYRRSFEKEWGKLFYRIKNGRDLVFKLLNDEALRAFGFRVLEESPRATSVRVQKVQETQKVQEAQEAQKAQEVQEGQKGQKVQKDKLISLLSDGGKRDVFIADIVKALSDNCNKTSTIDSQYNPTWLKEFRMYYVLKKTGDKDLKELDKQLAQLNEEYESLVTK